MTSLSEANTKDWVNKDQYLRRVINENTRNMIKSGIFQKQKKTRNFSLENENALKR
eukprot:UN01951